MHYPFLERVRRLSKQPGVPHNLGETNERSVFKHKTKTKLITETKKKAGFTG